MSDRPSGPRAELERRCAADPGDAGFALLAECYRRDGRLAEAERVARQGLAHVPESGPGLAVLVLSLLDADRTTEARVELEERAGAALAAWSPPAPERAAAAGSPAAGEPAPAVSVAELDRAFESAEPELDVMITPDRLAEEAALRVDVEFADAPDTEPSDVLGVGGAFSTRTMAELLEQQGDAEGAARIRASLGAAATPPIAAAADPGREARILAVLEQWLANVRRLST